MKPDYVNFVQLLFIFTFVCTFICMYVVHVCMYILYVALELWHNDPFHLCSWKNI